MWFGLRWTPSPSTGEVMHVYTYEYLDYTPARTSSIPLATRTCLLPSDLGFGPSRQGPEAVPCGQTDSP